ncbi:MAG: N-6 DNA methylase [Nitrososphaerota archaeon]
MKEKMIQEEKHFKSKEKVLGQFFTPQEVSDFIVSFVSMHLSEKGSGCDPACGDGVFLSSLIKHGFKEVIGVDIDESVIRLIPPSVREKAKILVGDALIRSPRLCGEPILRENYFDAVVGNPPFSSKYGRVRDKSILDEYDVGRSLKSQAIEVLFLERFIKLAKDNGIIGIILPDGIFLNTGYRKLREYILDKCRILAVVSLPRAIFNGTKSTTSKTSILFAIKGQKHEGRVFMAEIKDIAELGEILNAYKNSETTNSATWVEVTADSLHPRTYLGEALPKFKFPTFRLGELIKDLFCGGTEYGKKRKFADKGLRYISAKVVTHLGIDFSRDKRKFIEPNSPMDKKWAHVRVNDVVFVRVGVGCIGRACVIVDEEDLGVADDWIYVIRVNDKIISPYYLAIFLQTRFGKIQIDKNKRGVGTVTIPQRLLKEIIVPVPPLELQSEIEKEYKEMVKLRRNGKYSEAEKIFKDMIMKLELALVDDKDN